jgi:hypothetical protein
MVSARTQYRWRSDVADPNDTANLTPDEIAALDTAAAEAEAGYDPAWLETRRRSGSTAPAAR